MSEQEADVEIHVAQVENWLGRYTEDVRTLCQLLESGDPSPRAREVLVGVLNYQLKKMDITPDWVPDLGMTDDAMVLRVGAVVFTANNVLDLKAEHQQLIERLAEENEVVRQIIGDEEDYDALYARVRALMDRRVHGRTPEEVLADEGMRKRLLGDVDRLLASFKAPKITDRERFHTKLVAYLKAKL